MRNAITDKIIVLEAKEMASLVGLANPGTVDHDLLVEIFRKTRDAYQGSIMHGFIGCYIAGFIYGIRAERKRRKNHEKSYTNIAQCSGDMFMSIQEVQNNE